MKTIVTYHYQIFNERTHDYLYEWTNGVAQIKRYKTLAGAKSALKKNLKMPIYAFAKGNTSCPPKLIVVKIRCVDNEFVKFCY